MKKKEKQKLLSLILISLVIILTLLFITRENKGIPEQQVSQVEKEYIETQSDGTRINTSDKIKEKRTIDGITVKNITFTEKDGQTNLIADLMNTTDEKKDRFLINIVLYDKKGKEIGKIPGIIGEMQAKETIEMQASIMQDYIEAYDFKIETQ